MKNGSEVIVIERVRFLDRQVQVFQREIGGQLKLPIDALLIGQRTRSVGLHLWCAPLMANLTEWGYI